MSRFCDDAVRLEREIAAKIKGMLGRGDRVEDIAVWFGLSFRVVHAVQTGAVHPLLAPAPRSALPPRGPYESASHAYLALADVQAAERRLFDLALSATDLNRQIQEVNGDMISLVAK